MVAALAFVHSAPLLLEALGGGPADLRAACAAAVEALDGASSIVVVGASDTTGWLEGEIDATPYGAREAAPSTPLGLAHSVGATLLGRRPARHYGVRLGDRLPVDEGVGLLVVGDGTAKRTEKAPGAFDPRAEGWDANVEALLRDADAAGLVALDATLGAELMVGGLAAWWAAGQAALSDRGWSGTLHYAQAPYGVGYFVASWLPS